MPSSVTNIVLVTLALIALHGPAQAASPEPCGYGSTKSGQIFRVNGSDVFLRSSPNTKGEKLINHKASRALNSTEYLKIDNSVTVLEECSQGEWSRVRVKEPDWLQDSHIGWVQRSSLRGQKKDRNGIVEFIEADFIWEDRTAPYKKTIIAGVNKIHRENPRCKTIDPASADISPSKSTPSHPVFFVTCGSGLSVFNAFFSESDVEK